MVGQASYQVAISPALYFVVSFYIKGLASSLWSSACLYTTVPSRIIFQRVEILCFAGSPPAPYKAIDLLQDLKRKRKDLTGATSNLKALTKTSQAAHPTVSLTFLGVISGAGAGYVGAESCFLNTTPMGVFFQSV